MSRTKIRTVFNFFNYWLNAVDAHSIHSPFAFEFYQKVIASKKSCSTFLQIEALRQSLKNDHRIIEIKDYGAGSNIHSSTRRKVKDITRRGISTPRFSQMLSRIASHYQAQTTIELGTSLGINTLYLAQSSDQNQVTTFEGCPQLAAIAHENFDHFKQANIQVIEGDIDHTLCHFLAKNDSIDLVFFDANHRLEPTLNYFNLCLDKSHEGSIFVFDDIHWSSEMEKTWSKIKSHPKVSLSFDLFQAGVIGFMPTATRRDFVLEVPFW